MNSKNISDVKYPILSLVWWLFDDFFRDFSSAFYFLLILLYIYIVVLAL